MIAKVIQAVGATGALLLIVAGCVIGACMIQFGKDLYQERKKEKNQDIYTVK